MKIYSISDLHLDINNTKPMDIFGPVWHDYLDKIIADWNEKVNEDDVVILAGDYSWAMKLEEVIPDFDFLNKLCFLLIVDQKTVTVLLTLFAITVTWKMNGVVLGNSQRHNAQKYMFLLGGFNK